MFQMKYDLGTISSGGWDNLIQVTNIGSDERAKVVCKSPPRPSGLGSNGLVGAACMGRRTALGTLVGSDESGRRFREAIAAHGISTDYIMAVEGASTNQRHVFQCNGSRYIVKDDCATFEAIAHNTRRELLSLVTQTEALLVSNVPFELTLELANRCRRAGTLLGVAPGAYQLEHVQDIIADLLVLNEVESRTATSTPDEEPVAAAFQNLADLSKATQIVQTGGGSSDAFVLNKRNGCQWQVAPADIDHIQHDPSSLDGCGTGDVAAVATMLALLQGAPLEQAYANWGRVLATGYLLGVHLENAGQLDAWRQRHSNAFAPPAECQKAKLVA